MIVYLYLLVFTIVKIKPDLKCQFQIELWRRSQEKGSVKQLSTSED